MKDGERCYYLSVPNKNNWAGIKLLEGTYNADNFEKCIYVNEENIDEVNKIINVICEIRNIFISPWYDLAKPQDEFYRIYVETDSDIKTIDIKPCHASEWNDQTIYTNNYFKNKADADLVVNYIKGILGI